MGFRDWMHQNGMGEFGGDENAAEDQWRDYLHQHRRAASLIRWAAPVMEGGPESAGANGGGLSSPYLGPVYQPQADSNGLSDPQDAPLQDTGGPITNMFGIDLTNGGQVSREEAMRAQENESQAMATGNGYMPGEGMGMEQMRIPSAGEHSAHPTAPMGGAEKPEAINPKTMANEGNNTDAMSSAAQQARGTATGGGVDPGGLVPPSTVDATNAAIPGGGLSIPGDPTSPSAGNGQGSSGGFTNPLDTLTSARRTAWSGWGPAQFPKRHKVAGWDWDEHLNGFISQGHRKFACDCGEEHDVPKYSPCKCGKIWNSYVIGTGPDTRTASPEMFIAREIPVRPDVIVASRDARSSDRSGRMALDTGIRGSVRGVESWQHAQPPPDGPEKRSGGRISAQGNDSVSGDWYSGQADGDALEGRQAVHASNSCVADVGFRGAVSTGSRSSTWRRRLNEQSLVESDLRHAYAEHEGSRSQWWGQERSQDGMSSGTSIGGAESAQGGPSAREASMPIVRSGSYDDLAAGWRRFAGNIRPELSANHGALTARRKTADDIVFDSLSDGVQNEQEANMARWLNRFRDMRHNGEGGYLAPDVPVDWRAPDGHVMARLLLAEANSADYEVRGFQDWLQSQGDSTEALRQEGSYALENKLREYLGDRANRDNVYKIMDRVAAYTGYDDDAPEPFREHRNLQRSRQRADPRKGLGWEARGMDDDQLGNATFTHHAAMPPGSVGKTPGGPQGSGTEGLKQKTRYKGYSTPALRALHKRILNRPSPRVDMNELLREISFREVLGAIHDLNEPGGLGEGEQTRRTDPTMNASDDWSRRDRGGRWTRGDGHTMTGAVA